MTNPNNAVGTNAAYSGRTSPNALNDVIGGFTKGVLSGWACSPKSGMTVQLGGVTGTRDVALAEDNNGNKLTINNRSGAPVEVTLTGAPVANNRIDCIVAYVDNPATGDGSTTDNPNTCGIIAVSGTVAANPTAPSDATIRSAITTDGATGGTAYYVILASITVGTGVTTIGSGVIAQGDACQSLAAIADGSVTTAKLANSAVTSQKVDWTTLGALEDVTISFNNNSKTAKRLYLGGNLYAIFYHGPTSVTSQSSGAKQISIKYPTTTAMLCGIVKYTIAGQTSPSSGHTSFGMASADTYAYPCESAGAAISADLLLIFTL